MIDINSIFGLLATSTSFKICLGAFLLSMTSGILGIFISLKNKALLGDMLSHAVLPGIACSYIWFRTTNEWVIWLGAIGASIISLSLMELIKRYSKIKTDTILSLIMASFFGLGNVLIAYAQKVATDSSIAILEKFLLGQIALISEEHVKIISMITLLTFLTITFLWKEFKIFTFDEFFAKSMGFNNILISFILNSLLIGLIIISLKITGIIVTSALLIMPGVIARYLSDKLSTNIFIVTVIAFLSSFISIIISLHIDNMPTGPIIVIINTIFILLTYLFAPKYGILKRFFKQKKYKQQIKKFRQLIHFYHHNTYYEIPKLESFLFKEQYLYKTPHQIIITAKGIQLVENLINGRI
ncbi:metal ABC transporter permease [Candidatus Phytoplasma phoenicium]|uniref:ABC-type Mn/Zn transport system, permease n=1 Tax=Candidatus Phytoplasma phoenicium TaxID=198422 RepID=A0A0L0MJY1_9MOLU|nr:metal ABC transporter permease [Candidatus Phytoplasma phoenicium]KND62678.1 ABC-type Mn/Zn transport system, permease [Candidatus Phytoplasma phoenicium]